MVYNLSFVFTMFKSIYKHDTPTGKIKGIPYINSPYFKLVYIGSVHTAASSLDSRVYDEHLGPGSADWIMRGFQRRWLGGDILRCF